MATRASRVAAKILVFAAWTVILAVVNNYLIEPLWGQLVFTALTAAVMTWALDAVGRKDEQVDPCP
ncbi:hypothetical protein [Streptomyces sp. NBC_01565]|uniref:hypothetical protein n=1 Tax=unclassified Streptomyces TaxID=2593676 RepID=UPI0022588539|nr:hypothetical protein [Streptomyces sp. NBC_01565]MCX4546282.1 hypothetical protein [Streptomyces sp. NBC_01565]